MPKTYQRHIQLIIFDLDGTLTRPNLDFAEIRRLIGVNDASVLTYEYILDLSGEEKKRAMDILEEKEEAAAAKAELREGTKELFDELREDKIKTVIFTRNSRKSADAITGRLALRPDRIITREDAPLKPDPTAILELLESYGLQTHQAVMVGDLFPDIQVARNAGIRSILLEHPEHNTNEIEIEPDGRIAHLLDLTALLRKWESK